MGVLKKWLFLGDPSIILFFLENVLKTTARVSPRKPFTGTSTARFLAKKCRFYGGFRAIFRPKKPP